MIFNVNIRHFSWQYSWTNYSLLWKAEKFLFSHFLILSETFISNKKIYFFICSHRNVQEHFFENVPESKFQIESVIKVPFLRSLIQTNISLAPFWTIWQRFCKYPSLLLVQDTKSRTNDARYFCEHRMRDRRLDACRSRSLWRKKKKKRKEKKDSARCGANHEAGAWFHEWRIEFCDNKTSGDTFVRRRSLIRSDRASKAHDPAGWQPFCRWQRSWQNMTIITAISLITDVGGASRAETSGRQSARCERTFQLDKHHFDKIRRRERLDPSLGLSRHYGRIIRRSCTGGLEFFEVLACRNGNGSWRVAEEFFMRGNWVNGGSSADCLQCMWNAFSLHLRSDRSILEHHEDGEATNFYIK